VTNKRILIVEDDDALARLLRDNLSFEGFAVDCVGDGLQALQQARHSPPDLVLLDVTIPGLDGFGVCRALGEERERPPIIILTARTQQQDKVQGLRLGADDYVTKPFFFDELLARIQAVLRRSRPAVSVLALGETTIDFTRMRASRRGEPLELTSREYALLQYLAERAGAVVKRDELLRVVWGYREVPMTRTVDNFVARLRRKIEANPHRPEYIRTMHGDGYCLSVPLDR